MNSPLSSHRCRSQALKPTSLNFELLETRRVLASIIQVRAAGKTGEEAFALSIDEQVVAEWSDVGGDFSAGEFQQFNRNPKRRAW